MVPIPSSSIYAEIRHLWRFWAFFDESKTRIWSKLTLRASNIPGKHSDVAQGYQGFPNYSSHKYSARSNESMWENSKQVLEFTANCFNFQLESKRSFKVQECHFSSLRSPNFDHIAFSVTWSVTKCQGWKIRKGYVYFGQKVGHTNTKPGAKMRSESVKGCQWVLI